MQELKRVTFFYNNAHVRHIESFGFRDKSHKITVFQPGGSLTAKADVKNGVLTALSLDGPVTFPRSGVLAL